MFCALASIGAGPPVLYSNHTHPLQFTPAQITAMREIQSGPQIPAPAAALVDRKSNTFLWGQRADDPLPMASVTKLMTVLVALQTLSLDEMVTVPGAALVGGASMGLSAGEQASVETLVYGALLPSGNDAATALALAAAGTEAEFVERMNAQAATWGLTHTHFVNPTGLDAPGHVSSARDLAMLARIALADPIIAGIVAQPTATVGGYQLTNTNELLPIYEGANGVKTGTTEAAGEVLIASARRGQEEGISVVLGSHDRYTESRTLLDFYFGHWRWLRNRLVSDAINRITAPDGVVYELRSAARPLLLPVWQSTQVRPYRVIQFDAENKPSGLYQLWWGDQKLAETPIEFIPQYPLPTPAASPTP